MSSVIKSVVRKHISGTSKKAPVIELTVFVCNLTKIVQKELSFPTNRVYLTTRSLKHLYDKRTAEEFDYITENLPSLVKFPARIYKNKDGKTGGFCFYKEDLGEIYFCIIESNSDTNPIDGEIGMNYVVSAYRLSEKETKRENYLAGYELLWSWKDDTPSS